MVKFRKPSTLSASTPTTPIPIMSPVQTETPEPAPFDVSKLDTIINNQNAINERLGRFEKATQDIDTESEQIALTLGRKGLTSNFNKLVDKALYAYLNPEPNPIIQAFNRKYAEVSDVVISKIFGGGEKRPWYQDMANSFMHGAGQRGPEVVEAISRNFGTDWIKDAAEKVLGIGKSNRPPAAPATPAIPAIPEQDDVENLMQLDPLNADHISSYAESQGGIPVDVAQKMLMMHQDAFIKQAADKGMNDAQLGIIRQQRGSRARQPNPPTPPPPTPSAPLPNPDPPHVHNSDLNNEDNPPPPWAIAIMTEIEDLKRKIANVPTTDMQVEQLTPTLQSTDNQEQSQSEKISRSVEQQEEDKADVRDNDRKKYEQEVLKAKWQQNRPKYDAATEIVKVATEDSTNKNIAIAKEAQAIEENISRAGQTATVNVLPAAADKFNEETYSKTRVEPNKEDKAVEDPLPHTSLSPSPTPTPLHISMIKKIIKPNQRAEKHEIQETK